MILGQFVETLIILSLSLLLQCVKAYRPQELILYTEVDFTGKQKVFHQNIPDLRTDSIGRIAKSHCIVRGLWRISGIFNNSPSLKFIENSYGDEKNGKVCGTWNTVNQTAQYRSFHLIGSSDLDTPGLTLNTKSRFYGDEELYFEGSFLRLPAPIIFSSYGFTGKENWTIYKNTNPEVVNPESFECLLATIDPLGDYGVTFNTNKTLIVGAISRGCGPKTAQSTQEGAIFRGTDGPNPKPKPKPQKGSEVIGNKSTGSNCKISNGLFLIFIISEIFYAF